MLRWLLTRSNMKQATVPMILMCKKVQKKGHHKVYVYELPQYLETPLTEVLTFKLQQTKDSYRMF